jgi:hypothetical protein
MLVRPGMRSTFGAPIKFKGVVDNAAKSSGVVTGHLGAIASRPLPEHSLQGAGKILRPGCAGCLVLGNPVPPQEGQSISAPVSRSLNLAIKSCPL